MSLWRDEKYLRLLAPQLERFTQKHAHTYNFRCPLCGDSERVQTKARGYIFPDKQKLIFKCHNCSVALPFAALLRRVSRRLYDEYILERLREHEPHDEPQKPSTKPPEAAPAAVDHSQYVHRLSLVKTLGGPLKPVYDYAAGRSIPETAMDRLGATMKAHSWLLPLVGESKAAKIADDIPYLVQPMSLPDGTWYGAQLRMLTRKEYLTFRWSHDPLKVFGLDHWKSSDLTYVVEGPLDALFVPNTIAALGSDLLGATTVMDELDLLPATTPLVYVWDNEPRNKEVCRHIRNAISLHLNVVIWPRDYPKDINDMVQAGIDVPSTLTRCTYSKLRAELEFSRWKA